MAEVSYVLKTYLSFKKMFTETRQNEIAIIEVIILYNANISYAGFFLVILMTENKKKFMFQLDRFSVSLSIYVTIMSDIRNEIKLRYQIANV